MARRAAFAMLMVVVMSELVLASYTPSDCSSMTSVPSTFSTMSSLSFNDEFYDQSTYYYDVTQQQTDVVLHLAKESVVRFNARSNVAVLKVSVFQGTVEKLSSSTAEQTSESRVAGILPAGDYTLTIKSVGFVDANALKQCPSIVLVTAIIPKTTFATRYSALRCPTSDTSPSLFADNKYTAPVKYTYNSNTFFYMHRTASFAIVKAYAFELEQGGSPVLFQFKASMEAPFTVGGSVGMMLVHGTKTNVSPAECLSTDACVFGTHVSPNEIAISTSLSAGKFSLLFYSAGGDQDAMRTAYPCTPYSMTVTVTSGSDSSSSDLCSALPVPKTFNAPGFFDVDGKMKFREEIQLQLGTTTHIIAFNVSRERAYASEHSVDIDMALYVAKEFIPLAFSQSLSGDEGIVYVVAPGEYELRLYYFGFQDFDLGVCDTYILEVGINPTTTQTCGTEVRPDISDLPNKLATTGSYSYLHPNIEYTHVFPETYIDKEYITSVLFTLDRASDVQIVTYNDFYYGDATAMIVSGGRMIKAIHTGDRNVLHTTLNAGTYSLNLTAGRIQRLDAPLNGLPVCMKYRLSIEIATNAVVHPSCPLAIRVPKSFDGVGWSRMDGGMHFSAVFSTPNLQINTYEIVSFTVKQDSVIRFYIPEHHVDIDLFLYGASSNVPVDHGTKVGDEETILYHGNAGNYSLKIAYYHSDHDNHDCMSFNLQGSVTPMSKIPPKCADVIPSVDFLKHPDANGVISASGNFKFAEAARTLVYNFTTTKPYTVFKSSVNAEFGYGHVVLYLQRNNAMLSAPNVVVLSDTSYNSDKLGPIMLSPGSYSLVIAEPKNLPLGATQGCVEFSLSVRLAPYAASDAEAQSCNAQALPPSLNTAGNLLREDILLSRTVFVTVMEKKFLPRITNFTVNSPSVFRVYVADHKELDVDVILYSRNPDTNAIEFIDGCFGFDDEAMDRALPVGSYSLIFKYVLQYDSDYDTPQENVCYNHGVVLSLAPLTYLQDIASVKTPCTVSVPDRIVADGELQHGTYHWNTTSSGIALPFTTGTSTFVQWNIYAPFQTNAVKCYLDGKTRLVENLTPIDVYVPCVMVGNTAFITSVLPRGNYSVHIVPTVPSGKRHVNESSFSCYPYDIKYRINATDGDSDPCPAYVVLPHDLFNSSGGSVGHGGPQTSDGTIRLFMEQVPVPHGVRPYQTQTIKLMAPVTELMRVYVNAVPELDIDLQLYRGPNHTADNFVDMAYATDQEETMLVELTPCSLPYELVLMYWKLPVDYHGTCPSFSLEISIRPKTKVKDELVCPAEMPPSPLPQQSMDSVATPSHFVSFSGEFILSSQQQQIYKTDDGKFAYDITLTGGPNTTVFASVQYDFLVNDFDMILYETDELGHKSRAIARSWTEPNPDRTAKYNFGNALFRTQIPEGKYILTLQEDLVDKEEITGAYCHYFYMYAMMTSSEASSRPRVLEVNPSMGIGLDYNDDLLVQITFSEAVYKCKSLADNSSTTPAVFLTSAYSRVMLPLVSDFWNDCRLMLVLFDHRLFQSGGRYELIMDMAYFHPASDPTALFELDSGLHVYEMTSCQCNGHGTCISATNLTCICDHPYTGTKCARCKDGYHLVGSQCVQNIPCKTTTCSGHGACDDRSGVPVCNCDIGYATETRCASCSTGFHFDTNRTCVINSDRPASICDEPLLPASLDVIGLMKYGQEFHMLDDYYIDIEAGFHYTTFSIASPSMLRAYVAPSWIDVDIFVIRIVSGHDIEIIASATHFQGVEETIQVIMNFTGEYQLRFIYYNWDYSRTPECETFTLELQLAPFYQYAEYSETFCSANDNLPNMPKPGDGVGDFPVVPQVGYTFNPTNASLPFVLRSNGIKYFKSFSFAIGEFANQQAVLHGEIGYRFLTGEMTLVLEGGNKAQCANASKCLLGYNIHNRNILHSKLSPGNYTVWLMQPVPADPKHTVCSEFDFSLSIKYVPQEDSIFNCPAERLPLRLDNEEYLHFDRLHLAENFYIDSSRKFHLIYFTVQTPSVFRCSIPVHDVDIDILVFNRADMVRPIASSINYYEDELIYITLPVGGYALEIRYYYNHVQVGACNTFHMELAIDSVGGNSLVDLGCPADRQPRTPSWKNIMGQDVVNPTITNKVSFGVPALDSPLPKTFYYIPRANDSDLLDIVVMNLTFTTQSQYLLSSHVNYDFLTSDLDIVLDSSTHSRSLSGQHDYNTDFMVEVLPAGTYHLLVILVSPVNSVHHMDCVPWHFDIELTPTSSILDIVQTVRCLEDTRALPFTLNTLDLADQRIHIESDSWALPNKWDHDSAKHTIKFSVAVPSVFSLYVAQNKVDIDLLMYNHGSDRSFQSLVDHSQSYQGDEALHDLLIPGVSYEVDIVFMKFDVVVAACDVFNMEIGIVPVSDIDTVRTCPGGQDMWPPTPQFPLPHGVYEYDSEAAAINIYIQPVAGGIKTHVIPLALTKPCDIHVEVGYSFPMNDIALVLQLSDASSDVFGFNRRNRHVLNALNVPAGNHTLMMYTTHPPIEDTMHCIRYTFYMRVEQAAVRSATISTHVPYVPTTLNRVPFLWRDPAHHGIANGTVTQDARNCMHLHGAHLVNVKTRIDEMSFVITTKSIMRAYVSPHLLDIDLKLQWYNASTNTWIDIARSVNYGGEEVVYREIEAGSYKLIIAYYASSESHWYFPTEEDNVSFDLEFSVCASSILSLTQSRYPPLSHTTVIAPILPDPLGYYKATYQEAGVVTLDAHRYYGTEHPITKSMFNVSTDSIIELRSTSDFLLGDVMVMLKMVSPVNVSIPMINYYDGSGIYSVLNPGTFVLIVYQPQPLLQSVNIPLYYSLDISLFPVSQDTHHMCAYSTYFLPRDLNTESGGSGQFGGPINNGFAYIHGDHFLMHHSQSLAFTYDDDVLVRTFYSLPHPRVTMTLQVYDNDTGRVTPLIDTNVANQRTSVYNRTRRMGTARADFSYQLPWDDPCWDFVFNYHSAKLTDIISNIICPSNATGVKSKLPDTPAVMDADGFSYEYLRSYVPRNDMPNDKTWTYDIRVVISVKSEISVMFGYYGLSNEFEMSLLQDSWDSNKNDTVPVIKNRANILPESKQGGYVGDISIRQSISGTLMAGNYTIRLTSTSASRNLVPFNVNGRDLCFPYTYELRVTPYDVSIPYVRQVSPPGVEFASTDRELFITVSFSEEIYDSTGARVAMQSDDRIRNAFYLTEDVVQLLPRVANKYDSLGLVYDLVFEFESNLTTSKTYSLHLKPGRLFDADHNPLQLSNSHVYKTSDKTCWGHGHPGPNAGACECDAGYAHIDCSVCAAGYIVRAGTETKHDVPLVCVPVGSEMCTTNTCNKHGNCSDSTGFVMCHCNVGFGGERCSRCDDGFIGYPHCKRAKTCPYDCHSGECDQTTGKCVCPPGLAAPDCLNKVTDDEKPTALMSALRIGGVTLAISVMGAAIGVFVYQERRRRRGPQNRGRYRRIGLQAQPTLTEDEDVEQQQDTSINDTADDEESNVHADGILVQPKRDDDDDDDME